ncbi:hypothetical protein [Aridibaculum aurantiacum]|uniref:hypothetical protein n=1 Tax=Aridibaculum aurantiacum TaxID=2810307 RepID=UPI001A96C44A|nr:hypothetical protein [Aridibaculum aurantiacum]
MKNFSAYILTMLLAFAGSLFFPWWIIAVAAFIVAVAIPQKPAAALATGSGALVTLWTTIAMVISFQNDDILAKRVASILYLQGSTTYLIMVTAFLGGLVAGMAAFSGSLLRSLIFPKQKEKTSAVALAEE